MTTNIAAANAVVQKAIDQVIGAGREIGLQVAAYKDGELVVDTWGGLADPGPGRKVDGDTLFNVYSVTKAVAATALHLQAERGLIEYDAPIVNYWPEYGAHGKERTTVRDALTHRACVPQMPEEVTPEMMCDWDAMVRAIANLKPLAEPGTKTLYLSMTFGWIIGELVRRTDPKGRSLGQFVRDEIAAPLGIPDLWIGIPDAVEPRVAKQIDAMVPVPPEYLPPLFLASMPPQVATDARRVRAAGRPPRRSRRRRRYLQCAQRGTVLGHACERRRARRRAAAVEAACGFVQHAARQLRGAGPGHVRFPDSDQQWGLLARRTEPAGLLGAQPAGDLPSGAGRFDWLGRSGPEPGRRDLPQPAVQPDNLRRGCGARRGQRRARGARPRLTRAACRRARRGVDWRLVKLTLPGPAFIF